MESLSFTLPDRAIPTSWYNIAADLDEPLPPMLRPDNRQPVQPQDLAPLFPDTLVEQEFSTEREIDVPGAVLDVLRQWRPSPLRRARRLEEALQTPARIYYKYEGVSPSGSHKANTAVPQAYYNKLAGTRRITTETGAGQWGSAMSQACAFFGLPCEVYWVRLSHDQKPYRKALMETFGARVVPSPSTETEAGRQILKEDPDNPGSLGIAISEAVEAAVTSNGEAKYALGSVLNHVLLHQTLVGQEALEQLALADDYPDVVIGCTGGGSNFAGLAFPLMRASRERGHDTTFVAVEPTSCPTLTQGSLEYDFGDTASLTPLMRMHTLGHDFMPPRHHAGGLRYHGMAPLVSHLADLGRIEARSVEQQQAFAAAVRFARAEGIVPAPESTHAVWAAVEEALLARETSQERTILFNLSGHGHFDMGAYSAYLAGEMAPAEPSGTTA